MKLGTARAFLSLLLIAAAGLGTARAQAFSFTTDDENALAMMQIPGGIVVVTGSDQVKIEKVVMPPDHNAGDAVDLKEGDLILYVNGERVGNAVELSTLLDRIDTGKEVKLGVQRGEQKMIRSFAKPEPQTSFGGQGIRMEFNSEGGEGVPGLENIGVWPAGFIVGERNGEVVVDRALPIPGKAPELADIASGDVIVSVNAKYVTTVADLNAAYEAIAVGGSVKMEIEQKGIGKVLIFEKPQAPEMKMQIRTERQ
ncbi:MAG: hypothetical protein R2834_16285 [Rhodothermales bacterium]